MKQNLTVKELPETERPYEKLLERGAQSLSDAELIAIFIRCGYHGAKAVDVAQELLMQRPGGILNLYELSMEEMRNINGIGKVKAIELKAVAELSKRLSQQSRRKDIRLNNAETVAAYYMEQLRHERKEKLILAMFDSDCHLIRDTVLSVGTVNASLVSAREIFIEALRQQAVAVILLHNHPSGNPHPSIQDQKATEQVAKCGRMLGIQLSDHIIIGDHQYFSFKERGLL